MSDLKEFLSFDDIQQCLIKLTADLIKMARDSTWNKISDECLYIISLDEPFSGNSYEQAMARKLIIDKIKPRSVAGIMPEFVTLYPGLHDINLYIYKALKKQTIIEIRYYPKRFLDSTYRETVINDPSMWHAKVAIPLYATRGKKQKFDINWHHYHLSIRVRMFWTRLKYKINRKFSGENHFLADNK